MHALVDPGPVPTPGGLVEFITPLVTPPDEDVLLAAPLARGYSGAFTRNIRGYQPPDTEEQQWAGDARRILSERTLDVIIEGGSIIDAQRRLTELVEGLTQVSLLRYEGLTQEVAAWRGVTGVQPLGNGLALRVTLAYLPRTPFARDASFENVIGVI